MKFLGLLASLALATSTVFGQSCSPQKCDASKKPSAALSAPLQLVAVVDQNNPNIKYEIGGTVVINDDCHFTVENFYMFPGTTSGKWMGAKIGSTEGMALTPDGSVSAIDPNQPQTLSFDVSNVNPFCHAALLDYVGRISLVDSNYQLLAVADVNPSLTANGSSGSSSSVSGNSSKPNSNDATTAKWSMGLLGLTSIVAILLV